MDRKSTSGGCQLLGYSLVSWSSKKQSCVSLSSTEAEYVAAGSCCAQLIWMRQTLKDYGVTCDEVHVWCDNKVPSRSLSSLRNTSRQSILRFGPEGALMCRSSTLGVLADSGPFHVLLLTVLGFQSDFHD